MEDPPLETLLAEFGVRFHTRASEGDADRGGKAGKRNAGADAHPPCWLGAKLAGGNEARLQHVYAGGPAERAGLSGGDIVVAIDGLRATADTVRDLLTRRHAGEALSVHAFRRDELIVTELVLAEAPRDTCWLTLIANIDAEVRARRDAWLPGPAPGARPFATA
jgi:predicted metalloprotease with PDZ domain